MNPAQSAAQPIGLQHPLWRLKPEGWYTTQRSLASPAPDGTVAYYFDCLSQAPIRDDVDDDGPFGLPFYNNIGQAACQYIQALAAARKLEVADGPYIQLLEDDGAVPKGWVMIRALIWTEEFDLMVEVPDHQDCRGCSGTCCTGVGSYPCVCGDR